MRLRVALLGLTGLLPLAAHAQPVDGLYVGAGMGFDYLDQLDDVHGNPALRSDGGFVGLGSVGYGLGNGLRFEVEGNYRQNNVTNHATPLLAGGGDLQQYGGMANALYDFDIGWASVVPYAGIGFGYLENEFKGTSFYRTYVSPQGHIGFDVNNAHDGSAAGQIILGAAFPLSAALSLTTEGRFVGQFSQTRYTASVTANGAPIGSTPFHFDNATNASFLVGLRYAFNAAPPAPAPAPVPVAAPMPAPAKTYLVFFDWDKSDLTDRARQIIAEAAANSTKVQVTTIQVNGYTDLSGTPAYNLKLSVRRADAVKAELIKDGVAAGIIQTHGYGMEHPLVPTAAGVREPQNRRVEIIFR